MARNHVDPKCIARMITEDPDVPAGERVFVFTFESTPERTCVVVNAIKYEDALHILAKYGRNKGYSDDAADYQADIDEGNITFTEADLVDGRTERDRLM